MSPWSIAAVHLAALLLASAAAYVTADNAGEKGQVGVRRFWLCVPWFLLLANAVVLVLASLALWELSSATHLWLPHAAIASLHLASLLWMMRAERSRWPRWPLYFSLVAMLVVRSLALANAELQSRLTAQGLRIEGGQIAYRELPPRPDSESNAGPHYSRIAKQLLELDSEDLLDRPLGDAAVAPLLHQVETQLQELLAATRLPRCRFERQAVASVADEILPAPPILECITLSKLLGHATRSHWSKGEATAALDCWVAQLALAEHLLETPTMLSLMGSIAIRKSAMETAQVLLASERAQELDWRGVSFRASPAAPLLQRALFLDEAYSLSALSSLEGDLELAFWSGAFAADLGEYRRWMEQLRTWTTLSDEQLRQKVADDTQLRQQIRASGWLAALMVPPHIAQRILAVRESDAALQQLQSTLQSRR